MKRIAIGAALLAAVLTVAGCQKNSAAAGFSPEDLSLVIGGQSYRCNMDIEEVIDLLGTDYAYSEGMSCDYDGLDKTFAYETAQFYTNPLAEGDLINEIYSQSPAVATTRGITVGASRQEVLAEYGEPAEDEGYLLIYRLPDERAVLCFELEDDAVRAISLTTQPV